jgi:hypothetical protein|tara:strand:+ start:7062 stop:7271 length:210 start_codon:yes stop_codon:yes gene_type:complete
MDTKAPDWQRETSGGISGVLAGNYCNLFGNTKGLNKKGFIALLLSRLSAVQHGFWTVVTEVGIICKTII